jgi:hypothetical protein
MPPIPDASWVQSFKKTGLFLIALWMPLLGEENQIGVEIPLVVSKGGDEWVPSSGIRGKFYFKDLARFNNIDMVVLPSAGMVISRDQLSLEVQPISLVIASLVYRNDLLEVRYQHIGIQIYTMFLFSVFFLPSYSISEKGRIVRTIEPQYSLRWNIDEKYRTHEFGVVMGFWFPGFSARK